ncbi:MAG: M14 family metallopeptidase [Pseudomonadota bacterium]
MAVSPARMLLQHLACASFLFAMMCASTSSVEALELAGQEIPGGMRTNLRIDVPAGDDDPGTFIPVSVITGRYAGPTLLVVAGVHGYEFAPILAAERLAAEVDPARLAGTLVVVHVAHIPAFENRTPYVNPFDRKNLNRSFPGKPNGTQTERIAHALSTELIAKADFVADVHSGDGAEWLAAFVGVYGGPLASRYAQALDFTEAMLFPNIVRYKMLTQEQIDQGRSLNRQAVAQGLPTVLIEIGQNGSRDPEHVSAIVDGLKNAMRALTMTSGQIQSPSQAPAYFESSKSVNVSHSGIWHPTQPGGRAVKAGEIIGVVKDFTGEVIETVRSPIDGFGLYGPLGPPIRSGDSAMTIGVPVVRLD